jgi:hypothetical protein
LIRQYDIAGPPLRASGWTGVASGPQPGATRFFASRAGYNQRVDTCDYERSLGKAPEPTCQLASYQATESRLSDRPTAEPGDAPGRSSRNSCRDINSRRWAIRPAASPCGSTRPWLQPRCARVRAPVRGRTTSIPMRWRRPPLRTPSRPAHTARFWTAAARAGINGRPRPLWPQTPHRTSRRRRRDWFRNLTWDRRQVRTGRPE